MVLDIYIYVSCSSVLGKEKQFDKHIFFRSLLSTTSHVTISTISSKMGTESRHVSQNGNNHLPTTIFFRGKLAVLNFGGGSVTIPAFTQRNDRLKRGLGHRSLQRSQDNPHKSGGPMELPDNGLRVTFLGVVLTMDLAPKM